MSDRTRPNLWDILAMHWGRLTHRQHEEIAGLRDEIRELREEIKRQPATIVIQPAAPLFSPVIIEHPCVPPSWPVSPYTNNPGIWCGTPDVITDGPVSITGDDITAFTTNSVDQYGRTLRLMA